MKSVTLYPPGPIIKALTWCVGIKNEFEVEIATVRAKRAGLAQPLMLSKQPMEQAKQLLPRLTLPA